MIFPSVSTKDDIIIINGWFISQEARIAEILSRHKNTYVFNYIDETPFKVKWLLRIRTQFTYHNQWQGIGFQGATWHSESTKLIDYM